MEAEDQAGGQPAEAVAAPHPLFGANSLLAQLATLFIPLAIWATPLALTPKTHGALAILAFMLLAWVTEALDFALAGLIGCFLFWATGVAKMEVAFSGFTDPTSWFLFAAILMGVMAEKTIGTRLLCNWIILRLGLTYPRVLLGLITTNMLLTVFLPSGIARLVVLAPICMELMRHFGVDKKSNITRGMFVVISYTSVLFDKFMISGATSITGHGLIAKFGGVSISWSQWLLAFLPLDIASVLACWAATLWLFPPEKTAHDVAQRFFDAQAAQSWEWRAIDTRVVILTVAAVLLWSTDFIHHLNPAIVALGVVFVALLPRIGVLTIDDLKRANLMPFYFVASAVGMGAVMTASGAIDLVTRIMFGWMQPFLTGGLLQTTVLYWSAFVYHFFLASEISMMSTSLPPLMHFAKAHGLSPTVLGLTWVFAAGGKIFAYQSAVLAIGYSYGYFRARDLVKMGLVLTVAEFVLLAAVVQFYWPLIGIK